MKKFFVLSLAVLLFAGCVSVENISEKEMYLKGLKKEYYIKE